MKSALIVDGLPSSRHSKKFINFLEKQYDVTYCSFIEDLGDFTKDKIQKTLNKKLKQAFGTNDGIIISVSFGSYVVLHSDELISKYSDKISNIFAYSPVTRLSSVIDIETLPQFLNSKYKYSKVTFDDFVALDKNFGDNLLKNNLISKTKIIFGKKDPQISEQDVINYYKAFDIKITSDEHINISDLTNREKKEWT